MSLCWGINITQCLDWGYGSVLGSEQCSVLGLGAWLSAEIRSQTQFWGVNCAIAVLTWGIALVLGENIAHCWSRGHGSVLGSEHCSVLE
jgi:hypothetical protein